MNTKDIAGLTVQINEEGFMTDPNEWNKDIAVALAVEEGISDLTPEHWQVIEYCRKVGLESGSAPTLRNITQGAGVPTKALFGLFPKGPAKKVARISGLGKPEGCV
ncbi:MAG: TusE/DsrC/DsvC family sulfur relay protein [Chloroflexota bacterium]|nr:MAG: TusE/DsrC/DsvC family sulfur relay protein [Chloroflexota bacterium]